jgi:flagellin
MMQAGLSISEQLRTQIRGSNQARHNGEDAIALLKIADGAMNEVQNS